MAKFLRSGIVWVLGVVVSIFMSVLSLEGNLTSSIDGLTIKGLKAASTTFIPVVGKALSESVSSVLGATSVIKNAIGIFGIVIVIGICALPIIKLSVLTVFYNFASAICEPIADERIVNVIEQIGSTFKIFLAIMFFVTVLFIIGLAMILKISNASIIT